MNAVETRIPAVYGGMPNNPALPELIYRGMFLAGGPAAGPDKPLVELWSAL